MTDDKQIAHARAVEALARDIYDESAPRSAPSWESAEPMLRYQVMEKANDLANNVLKHFTPVQPDHAALVLQMEILASEVARVPLLSGKQVAGAIKETIRLVTNYGEEKADDN